MDENFTKIILAIIAGIIAVAGGVTLYSKNKRKSVNQNNINITGNSNKVVGGNDKSSK